MMWVRRVDDTVSHFLTFRKKIRVNQEVVELLKNLKVTIVIERGTGVQELHIEGSPEDLVMVKLVWKSEWGESIQD